MQRDLYGRPCPSARQAQATDMWNAGTCRWHTMACAVDSSSLPLAAVVFKPELGTQQPSRVVRHAPQPCFVCLPVLALLRILWPVRSGRRRGGGCVVLQRILHAFALGLVGLVLLLIPVLVRWHGLIRWWRIPGRIRRRFAGAIRRWWSFVRGRRVMFAGRALAVILVLPTLALFALPRRVLVRRIPGLLPATALAVLTAGRITLPRLRRLDHTTVGKRILHPGRLCQGMVIRGNRLVVAPLPCQCVAKVVCRLGTTCAGGVECLLGGGKIAPAVRLHALFQHLLRALVRTLPPAPSISAACPCTGNANSNASGNAASTPAPRRKASAASSSKGNSNQ